MQNRRERIDAEFAINQDDFGVYTDHGKPLRVQIMASEKTPPTFSSPSRAQAGTAQFPCRTMLSITWRSDSIDSRTMSFHSS